MTQEQLSRYANLLVNYCLSIQPGERLFVQSTTLAEPLIREVYRACIQAGGYCEVQMNMDGQGEALLELANDEQLAYIPIAYRQAMETFEAYLAIKAPFDQRRALKYPERTQLRQQAMEDLWQTYSRRTAEGSMKRSLCLFPCPSLAETAGMSLEEYSDFVYQGCRLNSPDPIESWLEVGRKQQHIVDYLNNCTHFRYKNERTDISFTTNGRTWINSDGRTNMPSGEVYTSPEEDSVNGTVYFDYPAIRDGQEVRGVTLWVENGEIQRWSAESGQEVLDRTFKIEGTRRFGEAAIGTNYEIDRFSKNILFDEKIGGTIHMAIGQSYQQAGGRNQSSVHWDMIADMTRAGEIYADGKIIYRKGQFVQEILNA